MLYFVIVLLPRPVGRGGSRGFKRTPLFTSNRFYIHCLTVHFKCPTVWKSHCYWESLLSKRVWLQLCEFVHGGPARNAHVSYLCRCEWKDAHKCIHKSLVQALESCPSSDVTPPAVLPTLVRTFSRGNSKSTGLANIHGQPKIGCNIAASHVATTALLLSQNSLRSNLRASNF